MRNIIIFILICIFFILIGCKKDEKTIIKDCKITTETIDFYNKFGIHWEECDLLNNKKNTNSEIDDCVKSLFENIIEDSIITWSLYSPPSPDSIELNPLISPVPIWYDFRLYLGKSINDKYVSVRITDSDFNVLFSASYYIINSDVILFNTDIFDVKNMELYTFHYCVSDNEFNTIKVGSQVIVKIDSHISSYDELCESLRKIEN